MSALDLVLALDPCQKASAPLNAMLQIAESQTGTAYGKNRNLAVAYLALHMMALQARNRHSGGTSISGQITSEAEGDLSVSYAPPGQLAGAGISQQTLQQTAWGMELLRLRSGSFIAGGMRTRMDCE